MLKDFVLFIKYPYTAGVIATIWLGSAALIAINDQLSMFSVVVINTVVTVAIARIGFSGKGD